jgi:hypothetical protein
MDEDAYAGSLSAEIAEAACSVAAQYGSLDPVKDRQMRAELLAIVKTLKRELSASAPTSTLICFPGGKEDANPAA